MDNKDNNKKENKTTKTVGKVFTALVVLGSIALLVIGFNAFLAFLLKQAVFHILGYSLSQKGLTYLFLLLTITIRGTKSHEVKLKFDE